MSFIITNEEENIFKMILSCTPNNVVPRVAGGWVRDKLMGINSYDMDIALENITGYEFAKLLEQKFKDSMSNVNVVQINPDKSKHLETAVCRINGILIDFVNLRCEKYTDTRIPLITIGTAQEDAFRRDLTINALFYNLITKEVEDFTGMGIKDIKNKILRTPLDPFITFSDDPLRILRLFRFRAKLNFNIYSEIQKSLNNLDLKLHLKNKVSKERVNIEIFKMINYKYGYLGIHELIQYEYIESVFNLKLNKEKVLDYYQAIKELNDEEYRWIYNLYIIFLESSCQLVQDKNKKKFLNFVICRDNLCCSSRIINTIKEIEEGLYLYKMLNFEDLTLYNIYFIIIILGSYYQIILKLECIKNNSQILQNFINYLDQHKISYNFSKPKIDIKDIDKKLNIEKKYISYIVKEIKVYQICNPDSDLLDHLLRNKLEIINKFDKVKIPYLNE